MAPRSLLVFDGDCGFCTSSARWLERRLPPDVDVQPWQRLDLEAIGLTEADTGGAAWWIDGSGRAHRGHRAVAGALRASSGVWRIVGRTLTVPPVSWLARGIYAVIARYRYRLPGATDACRVPG